MKKIVSLLIVTLMLTGLCNIAHAESEIKVYLNGEKIEFDVPPMLINDRTMVPMRAIFEALDATVDWDDATQTATAEKDGTKIKMTIDSNMVFVGDNSVLVDVPPQLVNDRTLVPLRIISESFGANVEWNERTQTVVITDKDYTLHTNDENNESVVSNNNDTTHHNESTTEVSNELKCKVTMSNSIISMGGEYRIMFRGTVSADGGSKGYQYRYAILKNDIPVDGVSYSTDNNFEGTITGTGKCTIVFYVQDRDGNEASQEYILVE